MNHFCIIGLGETGASVAAILIEKHPGCRIDIIDPSDWIKGRFLDLAHAAVMNCCEFELNNYEAANTSDIIFYCAGIRNEKGGDRLSVVQENKKLIPIVFEYFSFSPNALIIVITNPVELIAQWISEYYNHQVHVIGTGTALDQFRLHYILSKKLSVPVDKIEVSVIGEHGNAMIPVYSQGKVDGVSIETLLSEEEREEITKELVASASKIRETEEATKYGVAQCAIVIADAWGSKEDIQLPVSVHIDDKLAAALHINKHSFLSFPCIFQNKTINLISTLDINSIEKEQLKKAALKLMQINQSVENV